MIVCVCVSADMSACMYGSMYLCACVRIYMFINTYMCICKLVAMHMFMVIYNIYIYI